MNAKWLGIFQWLQIFPYTWHMGECSLDPCWPWVWLLQWRQGLVDLLLCCPSGCVGFGCLNLFNFFPGVEITVGHQTWPSIFVTWLVINFPNVKLHSVILWTKNWKLFSFFVGFKEIYEQSGNRIQKIFDCMLLLCHIQVSELPVWPNGWVFVYEVIGCGFKSHCCHPKDVFLPHNVTNNNVLALFSSGHHFSCL